MGYNDIKRMSGVLDVIGSVFGGGGGDFPTPPPPQVIQAPSVRVSGTAKGKRKSLRARRRQALFGQSSMSAGGSAGGSQSGQTLLGG